MVNDIEIKRTSSSNQDFCTLVEELNSYLKTVDGDDHDFYHQFNGIENLEYVVIAYLDKQPVGCGAIKEFSERGMELKRMYTQESARGRGIASSILKELEQWTIEIGKNKCFLETGKRQVEAIQLYLKNGYQPIDNYEPYVIMDNSVCFAKALTNYDYLSIFVNSASAAIKPKADQLLPEITLLKISIDRAVSPFCK